MEEIMKKLQELENLALLGAKKVLNVGDVSMLSGLSKSHIYKLVCAKRIPYYKSEGGKITYFDRDEIEKWLLHYRVPTNDEITQKAIEYCGRNPR